MATPAAIPVAPSPLPDSYTIISRSTPFILSHSQLTFESPNYFTSAFLEHDFAEAESRSLQTDRNPELFAIIADYLAGYEVLPLHDDVPRRLNTTMAVTLRNLRADAEYFQLDGLVEKVDKAIAEVPDESSAVDKLNTMQSDLVPFLKYCGLKDTMLAKAATDVVAQEIFSVAELIPSSDVGFSGTWMDMFHRDYGLSIGAARHVIAVAGDPAGMKRWNEAWKRMSAGASRQRGTWPQYEV